MNGRSSHRDCMNVLGNISCSKFRLFIIISRFDPLSNSWKLQLDLSLRVLLPCMTHYLNLARFIGRHLIAGSVA